MKSKLTKAQRSEVKSLIEDSGWTRAEATAWVLAFDPKELEDVVTVREAS